MKNNIIAMAIAASMMSMQRTPPGLMPMGHKIAAGNGGNNFNRHQAKNKTYRVKNNSKYTVHQGEQECARRLRHGSAAWHSGVAISDFPF